MKPEQESPATMRRCLAYLVNLVLRAPAPLSLEMPLSNEILGELFTFAEEYSEWYDRVTPVRQAYEAKKKREEQGD